jgi:Cu2+-exporting ATPase
LSSTSSAHPSPADLDAPGLFLGDENGIVARFEIAESIRAGATEALSRLKQRGIDLMIASGDRLRPVRDLAAALGIDDWRSDLRPGDKLSLIRELQADGKFVAMIGDGINDAPVLAGANVSIAMGSGTSLAQHSADCVMMSENLSTLSDAFEIARRTYIVVRQNLVWAICYNIIALPLAATGLLAPWMAALGMSMSSLIVTLNALRLSRSATPATKSQDTTEPCCTNPPLEPTA